jgi:hypothetical protein
VKLPWPGRACLHHEDEEAVCDICSLKCPVTLRRYSAGIIAVGRDSYLCPRGRFQTPGGPDIRVEGSPEEADVIVLNPGDRRWLELEFTPMAARVKAASTRGVPVLSADSSATLAGRVCRLTRV